MAHGLSQWLSYLSDKSLPLLNLTRENVQSRIDQSQLSITQYALPVLFDAGFAAYIFHYVNTQRVAAGKNPLTTLDNALSHLGGTAFQRLLNGAPVFEKLKLDEKNRLGYIRVMGQACHAGLQARDWGKQRGVVQAQEMQLAASLQSITELMLWCYADTAMSEIEYLYYIKKKKYEDATSKVLGCAMRELGAALADRWELPEMAVEGLRSRHDNFTLATGVSLAAELSRVVARNWYGRQAEEIIQRISKYQARPEGEISRQLHLNAVNFTDDLLAMGFAVPARLIPMLAADDFIDLQYIFHKKGVDKHKNADKNIQKAKEHDFLFREKHEKSRVTETASVPCEKQTVKKNSRPVADSKRKPLDAVSGPAQKKTHQKKMNQKETLQKSVTRQSMKSTREQKASPAVSRELAAAIKAFQLMVVQAKPAHDLVEKIVKISLLCGVQRCVFLIKVPNKEILVSRYAAQIREDIAIVNLKIPINNPHVFTLLMEKSRNLFLNDLNRQKYWNGIPDKVKLKTGVKAFFAVSIFANTHAMGLMYADKVKGELTQQEFANFQGVCRLLSKGIVQSAQNKKTPA